MRAKMIDETHNRQATNNVHSNAKYSVNKFSHSLHILFLFSHVRVILRAKCSFPFFSAHVKLSHGQHGTCIHTCVSRLCIECMLIEQHVPYWPCDSFNLELLYSWKCASIYLYGACGNREKKTPYWITNKYLR